MSSSPWAPVVGDLASTFERLHVSECEPPIIDRQSVLKKILLQDEYYVRIARELLPAMESGRPFLSAPPDFSQNS